MAELVAKGASGVTVVVKSIGVAGSDHIILSNPIMLREGERLVLTAGTDGVEVAHWTAEDFRKLAETK